MVLKFSFHGKERAKVLPYKLVNYKGVWYLAAIEDSQLKAFNLGKISLLNVTENRFKPNVSILERIEAEDSIWYGEEKIDISLHASKDVAYYFERRQLLPNQEICHKTDNGTLIVTSKVSNLTQIIPLIKYWIPHVHVISPIELKEQLRFELQKYMKMEFSES